MAGRGGNNGGRGNNNNNRGREGGRGNGNGKGGAGAKTCNICSKAGHLAADCRSAGKTFRCTKCNMNNHTTADCTRGRGSNNDEKKHTSNNGAVGKGKISRPCRFCRQMHLDKDCPTKGENYGIGSGKETGNNRQMHDGDTDMRDAVFGAAEISPSCQHCGGQHLSIHCPKNTHQPEYQYKFQRYPALPTAGVSLWDAVDDLQEEFVIGVPWNGATSYGPVYSNVFPAYHIQPAADAFYPQQQERIDIDGDIIMS